MSLNVNPLAWFEVGRTGGAVSSPGYGPNQMVSGLLQQLESAGVVSAQARQQGAEARATALFKEGITTPDPMVYGGTPPQAETQGDVIKVPKYDAQGRWAGYEYKTKPGSFNFFAEDAGTPAPGAPAAAAATEELTPQQELLILQQLLNKRQGAQ